MKNLAGVKTRPFAVYPERRRRTQGDNKKRDVRLVGATLAVARRGQARGLPLQ